MKNDPNGASFVSSEEALRQTRSALLAIPEAEVLREARVDVRHAFGVVTASVQHLAAHRAALIALCGPETGELLDRLPIAAAATEHTALLVQMADIGDRVPALREVARRQHRLVFGDAMALVRRGRLKEAAIEHLRVVASDAQLIQALSGLALVLRREWPQIEAHTPLTWTPSRRPRAPAGSSTTRSSSGRSATRSPRPATCTPAPSPGCSSTTTSCGLACTTSAGTWATPTVSRRRPSPAARSGAATARTWSRRERNAPRDARLDACVRGHHPRSARSPETSPARLGDHSAWRHRNETAGLREEAGRSWSAPQSRQLQPIEAPQFRHL